MSETMKKLEFLRLHKPAMYLALKHHRTHKGEMVSFFKHEYLREFLMDDNPYICVKKSTQGGYTEILEVISIAKAITGRGVFYVMPTERLVSRFVKNRIDKSIAMTEYYRQQVKESGNKGAESVSLKHIGRGVIAYIPSNSTSAFTEFPADDLIIDELDECDQSNLSMADERLSHSKDPRIIKIGNPTIQEFGIDYEFLKSDRKEWHIRCRCKKWVKPEFFVNVVQEVENNDYVLCDDKWDENSTRDINMICQHCGKPLDKFGEGEWVAENPKSRVSGYHVSKLFSTNMPLTKIVQRFQDGLKDDSKLQRFYNGDLGVAFTGKGSKLSYDLLNDCKADYTMPDKSSLPCVMGVDVGNVCHVKIGELQPDKKLRIVYIGTVSTEEDIMNLYRQYKCKVGCIDAMPERRMSKKLATVLRGMFTVYYGDVKVERISIDDKVVVVDRTSTLDGVREAVLTQQIILPKNADKLVPLRPDGVSEYYYEMCTSTRIYNEEKKRYAWVEGTAPDHFMHATNYMLIAKRILMKVI